jgi:hypothetical protein
MAYRMWYFHYDYDYFVDILKGLPHPQSCSTHEHIYSRTPKNGPCSYIREHKEVNTCSPTPQHTGINILSSTPNKRSSSALAISATSSGTSLVKMAGEVRALAGTSPNDNVTGGLVTTPAYICIVLCLSIPMRVYQNVQK